MKNLRWTATLLMLLLSIGGAVPARAQPPDLRSRPLVLLGEVHDHAEQHALRVQAFRALLASGARPALLMEQFDRERQGDLDRLRMAGAAPTADQVIAAAQAANGGWTWSFYRPFIQLAIEHGLPIVAVNVSRAEARQVVAQGLAATGFDAAVPDDIEAAQAQAIEASHCGMVDSAMARRMATAQVARDQAMARAVERHAARGVVLLAGNGHVRRDIGVPRWLSPALRAQVLAVGMLEEGDRSVAAYDQAIVTPPQPRADPCAAMRAPSRPST